MIDGISIIGAVASILGAVYAWRQASNAKKYATKAGAQFTKHRSLSELAHLKPIWKSTYEALAPFGPSARPAGLRGRSTADAARKAQDYIAEVKNRKSHLSDIRDMDDRFSTLQNHLAAFSEASSEDDIKTHGTNLLNALEDLDAAICSILNAAQEKVDL